MYSIIQIIDLLIGIGIGITLWIPYSIFTISIRYISIIGCILLILYFGSTKCQNIVFESQSLKVLMILRPFIWLSIHVVLLIAGK